MMRFIKIIGAVMVLAVAGGLLVLFDIIPLSRFQLRDAPNEQAKNSVKIKVKRPAMPQNASYQELIDRGNEELYLGNTADALAAFQKASQLLPKETLPYERIGELFAIQKNYKAAAENFQFALTLAPEKASLKIKNVQALLGLRKIVDAKIALEKIQPETQQSIYYSALLAAFLNEQDRAKELLKKASETGEDETLKAHARRIENVYIDFEIARGASIEYLQTLLAKAFNEIGEYGLSIELAFNALKTEHNYRDAWLILGHAFLSERKWFDAEDAFKKAIELDASHPAGYFFRGVALRSSGKLTAAVKDFEQAIRTGWRPQILAKEQLAEIFFELKDFEKAFGFYKEIVTTDPSDTKRFIRPIALALNHLKKPNDALTLAASALEAHPDSALAESLLGWAYLGNNDLLQAREHIEKALKRDPQLASGYLNLGQLEERIGRVEAATAAYKKAIDFAKKDRDLSVFETAQLRYDALSDGEPSEAVGTTTERELPSLSLE